MVLGFKSITEVCGLPLRSANAFIILAGYCLVPKGRGCRMITLIIIPNKGYQESTMRITKRLSEVHDRICYVSLNERHDALTKGMRRGKIPVSKFFIVDAITRNTKACKKADDNCAFVSSPNSLMELSLAITDAIKSHGAQALMFDSISTLLIYETAGVSTKFMHSLIGKIKEFEVECVLTALEGDKESETVRDLGMFVNETITMAEYDLRYTDKKNTEEGRLPKKKIKQAIRPELKIDEGYIEVIGGKKGKGKKRGKNLPE